MTLVEDGWSRVQEIKKLFAEAEKSRQDPCIKSLKKLVYKPIQINSYITPQPQGNLTDRLIALLKAEQIKLDKTNTQFAVMLGMSPANLSSIYSGKRNPTLSSIEKWFLSLGKVVCLESISLAKSFPINISD